MGWNGSESDGLRRPRGTGNPNGAAGGCRPRGAGPAPGLRGLSPAAGSRAGRPVPGAVSRRRRRAGAAAALAALGALGLLLGRAPAPGGDPVAAGPVPAASSPRPPSRPDAPAGPRPAHAPVPAPARRLWRGVEVVSSAGAETNRDGAVVERLVLADGRRVRAVALPPPAFRHPSDQLLAMALSAGPGEALPPLPLGPDVERGFLRALEDPVEALPTDPAGVRELKRRVAEAREALAGEVRAGRRVRDALEEYQRGREREADVRLAAVREAGALLEAEGAEAARRFAARANEALRAHGVPEIPVPGGRGPAGGDVGDGQGQRTEGD